MVKDNRSRSEPHQRTEVEGLKVVVHALRPQLDKNRRHCTLQAIASPRSPLSMECAQGQSPEVPCREFKGSGGFAQKGLSAKDIRRDGKRPLRRSPCFRVPVALLQGPLQGTQNTEQT